MTEALTFASTRLNPTDAGNIGWYCLESPGDLGLKSNLGPMLDNLQQGSRRHKGSKPVIRHSYDLGSHSDEADLARLIGQRLERLDPVDRRTLVAAYGSELTDAARERWGWLLDGCPFEGLTLQLLLITAERLGVGRRQLRSWSPERVERCPTAIRRGKRRRLRAFGALGLRRGLRCVAASVACMVTPEGEATGLRASALEPPAPPRRRPHRIPRCTAPEAFAEELASCALALLRPLVGPWPAPPRCGDGESQPGGSCGSAPDLACRKESSCLCLNLACEAAWPADWMTLRRLWEDADEALVQACRAYRAAKRVFRE